MPKPKFPRLSDGDWCDLEFDLMVKAGNDPEDWQFNEAAYMALGNIRAGAASHLIALFRSDEPIDRIVREEIARALERGFDDKISEEGISLKVAGGGDRTHGHKIYVRQQYAIIGRFFFTEKNKPGGDAKSATAAALKAFPELSDKKLGFSKTYYNDMNKSLVKAGYDICEWPSIDHREMAEHAFHLNDIEVSKK